MADHRDNIRRAAETYLDSDPMGEDVLEVEVFTSEHSYRVEFLLSCGGPTTRAIVDSRDSGSLEFHYSWGKESDADDSPDCTTLDVWSDLAAAWVHAAEMIAECHA